MYLPPTSPGGMSEIVWIMVKFRLRRTTTGAAGPVKGSEAGRRKRRSRQNSHSVRRKHLGQWLFGREFVFEKQGLFSFEPDSFKWRMITRMQLHLTAIWGIPWSIIAPEWNYHLVCNLLGGEIAWWGRRGLDMNLVRPFPLASRLCMMQNRAHTLLAYKVCSRLKIPQVT